ncbi:MAG TPA: biliverdin-producing heme oxygenase [Blastocatellia bacterium]|nr:biliverdin-producing heme oxygenase [Blastocatellia bacterium]
MVLNRLKHRTLLYNQRLEKKLDLYHSVKTIENYRFLLGKFLGFYEPVEAALEANFDWSVIKFDFRPRKKTPLLMRDLNSLGIAETRLLPRCGKVPKLDTLPRAFGCLYVFESATLGRAIVIRHLTRTLGVTPEDGGAFFSSYGDWIVSMWRDFGQRLSAYASKPDLEEAVIGAAIDTLICLDQWMTGRPVAVAQLGQMENPAADKQKARIQQRRHLRLL